MTSKYDEDHDDLDTSQPRHESAPRQRHPRRRPYRRATDGVLIERVETTEMTAEQYSSAVATLAGLIERWQQDRYSQSDSGDAAA